jgi:hypothetical protein
MQSGKWEKVCQGFSTVEGTSHVVLGFFDQQKVLANLSLFLKNEKNPNFA